MELSKNELLKECKNLLRKVNCEAIIDTKGDTLYDVLFKSHEKKKMLLSWLIQQLYSADCCNNNSLEDLSSIFISKPHWNNFISGKMSMLIQFKYWKIILNALCQLQKRGSHVTAYDVDTDLESGTLFGKYETIRSEKLGSILNYIDLANANETRFSAGKLHSLLETVKRDYISLKSSLRIELYQEEVFTARSQETLLETFLRSDEKLNIILKAEHELSNLTQDKPVVLLPDYQQLDQDLFNGIINRLSLLEKIVGVSRKTIDGVENSLF